MCFRTIVRFKLRRCHYVWDILFFWDKINFTGTRAWTNFSWTKIVQGLVTSPKFKEQHSSRTSGSKHLKQLKGLNNIVLHRFLPQTIFQTILKVQNFNGFWNKLIKTVFLQTFLTKQIPQNHKRYFVCLSIIPLFLIAHFKLFLPNKKPLKHRRSAPKKPQKCSHEKEIT